MEILFILLPVALGFVLATVFVFSWAVRGGQFDDMETPALRMLLDETATADAARKERR
ncbi:MAG: cbb3-type cytochrome oxidase assembly protein CcoS [Myxococcales bacterium]|nr:cbb3-type cytochrome oxidase assembly protein CcoS [Myxococcales bacterium]MCB9523627.1 cbb3-type cytochrome oxidase assembly protein CcoS [Myxococcales bacterium]